MQFGSSLNQDYWLAGISGITETITLLEEVNLRFDDQVYLYKVVEVETLEIFEAYKILGNDGAIILNYGVWNGSLNVNDDDIWQRRKDLQVCDKNSIREPFMNFPKVLGVPDKRNKV